MELPGNRNRASEEIAAARARIGELEAELARLSARDPLVASLLTLSAFRARLELDVLRALRYRRPLAVAVVDIDRFRHLNMARGYGAGDMVLAAVGDRLSGATRAPDLVCRAGDDEYIILFPETSADQAAVVLERVLATLADIRVAGVPGLSASAGVAALARGQNADSLLARAENALAVARSDGEGRVRVSGASAGEPGGEEDLTAGGEIVAALAQAFEQRDARAGEGSDSVVDLTGQIAESLGLDHDEVRIVRSAALLHDIGKVAVPEKILMKPAPLDDHEWEVVRRHPEVGERILRAIPGMAPVARIVRHEHERWDGGGYPDGLAGEAIPVGSRIILACDAYHAMCSARPHREAMSHREAVGELTRNAGTQFDPRVVEVLVGYLFKARRSGLAVV